MNNETKIIKIVENYIHGLLQEAKEVREPEVLGALQDIDTMVTPLYAWFVRHALDSEKWNDGTGEAEFKPDFKPIQIRVFSEIRHKLNKVVSYYNLFHITKSLHIDRTMKAISPNKASEIDQIVEEGTYSNLTFNASHTAGLLPFPNPKLQAIFEGLRWDPENPDDSSKIDGPHKADFADYDASGHAMSPTDPDYKEKKMTKTGDVDPMKNNKLLGFFNMLPAAIRRSKGTEEKPEFIGAPAEANIGPVVSKALVTIKSVPDLWQHEPAEPPNPADQLEEFKKTKLETLETAKKIGAQQEKGDHDAIKAISEALKASGYDDTESVDLARALENITDGKSVAEQVTLATALLPIEQIYTLMGFATYFVGRELLYPVDLGIDILSQRVFKEFKESITPFNGWDDWHNTNLINKILPKTRFGKIYKEIPAKIKEYATGAGDPASASVTPTPESFLSKVVQNEKLDKIAGRNPVDKISQVLQDKIGDPDKLSAAKKDTLNKIVQNFMKIPEEARANELTAKILRIFETFASSAVVEGSDESEANVRQWAAYLSNLTGGQITEEQIYSNYNALNKKSEFVAYYKDITEQLKYDDEHFMTFAKHIYSHLEDFKEIFKEELITVGSLLPEPEPEPETTTDSDIEKYKKRVKRIEDDFLPTLGFHLQRSLRNQISNWKQKLDNDEMLDDDEKKEVDANIRELESKNILSRTSLDRLYKFLQNHYLVANTNLAADGMRNIKDLLDSPHYERVALEPDSPSKRAIKKIHDYIENDRDLKSAWRSSTSFGEPSSGALQERMKRVIESIIRQMLKEENGEKELCD